VRGETGRSFRELKAAAQLEHARKLLASSELSILEVGLRTPAANRAGPGPASSPGLRRIHAHSARVRRPH
jgi:hypothetical protein